MADNSNDRKKVLIISMLIFLLGGGGIFLFFIIQGSNDLTGAGKSNFQYGNVTRGAVSSFFKVLGFNDAEPLSRNATVRVKARGLLEDEPTPPKADISDWMTPAEKASGSGQSPSRSATAVPRMGGRGTSGVGGLGGGGSQSSGGISRFSDGAEGGKIKLANAEAGAAGVNGKGTLAALANTRAMLGQGLNSGSAMTAKSSWDRSFGVGAASQGGPSMAYGKTGLVSLDKIKKGEVDNLKTTDIKSLKTPEPGAFKEDKDLEASDPVLKKATEEAAADAAKKAAAQALVSAAASGLNGASGTAVDKPETKSTAEGDPKVNGEAPPPKIMDAARGSLCAADCKTGDGQVFNDRDAVLTKNSDGSYNCVYSGTQTNPITGAKFSYSDTVLIAPDGTKTLLNVKETNIPNIQ